MAKKAKTKALPPMSEARKKILQEYGVDESQHEALQRQLCETPEKELRQWCETAKLPWSDDRELLGNAILTLRLESDRRFRARVLRHLEAYKKHFYNFQRIFGRSLREFWEGNIIGFDLCKFEERFFPENHDSDDKSLSDFILAKHGPAAVAMIKELLGTAPDTTKADLKSAEGDSHAVGS